jgi:hypothetical protein
LFLFAKQTNQNQSNRRSTVHSPLVIPGTTIDEGWTLTEHSTYQTFQNKLECLIWRQLFHASLITVIGSEPVLTEFLSYVSKKLDCLSLANFSHASRYLHERSTLVGYLSLVSQ